MKWSWKAFGLQLAGSLALGIAFTYALCAIIDARRGPGAPDATLQSLAVGGFAAPLLLAALSGWKGWNPKPMLAAGVIVALLYSSNPGVALLAFIAAGFLYYAARKGRAIVIYFLPANAPEPPPPGPRHDPPLQHHERN